MAHTQVITAVMELSGSNLKLLFSSENLSLTFNDLKNFLRKKIPFGFYEVLVQRGGLPLYVNTVILHYNGFQRNHQIRSVIGGILLKPI